MKRLLHALRHSVAGLLTAWHEEAAFRQDVVLFLISIPFALWLAPNHIALILMIGSGLLVVIVELLNTGIEAAIDRIGSERHPQSKKAKDCGSAAVLLALLLMAFTWIAVLL
jgi:diacylglycerol kinase (ATP)